MRLLIQLGNFVGKRLQRDGSANTSRATSYHASMTIYSVNSLERARVEVKAIDI